MRKKNQKDNVLHLAVVVLLTLSLVCIALLAGCMVSEGVTYGEKGPMVGDNTLNQIELGKTTKEWLVTVLGEPSSEDITSTGLEILKYEYSKTNNNHVFVLPLLVNVRDRHKECRTLFFELKDGVVIKCWKED